MEELEIIKENLPEIMSKAVDGKLSIEIRTGKAKELLPELKPIEQKPLSCIGGWGTVALFVTSRHHLLIRDECHIEIAKDFICLHVNERCKYNDTEARIVSAFKFSDNFNSFGLLDQKEYKPNELAKFLRKWKNKFASAKQYSEIFLALSSFQAEVNRKIEKTNKHDGNLVDMVKQEVTSNLPREFEIMLSVFEQTAPVKLLIEIDIDPVTLNCSLFCSDLFDIIEKIRDELIENELSTTVFSNLVLKDFCFTYFSK
jgi:hypothetical protein